MSAVFFGSISTLADTSELQRRAFNEAFAAHGLDWNWSRDDVPRPCSAPTAAPTASADFAKSVGCRRRRGGRPRDQVGDLPEAAGRLRACSRGRASSRPSRRAKRRGTSLGLVTTTLARKRRRAPRGPRAAHRHRGAFDVVVVQDTVDQPKPDGACYRVRAASDSGSTRTTPWRSRTTSAESSPPPPRASRASRSRTRTPQAAISAPPPRPSITLDPSASVALARPIASRTSDEPDERPCRPGSRHAERSFRVEGYEQHLVRPGVRRRRLRAGNPDFADCYRAYGRALMVVDETVYRPVPRADRRLLRPPPHRADGGAGADP